MPHPPTRRGGAVGVQGFSVPNRYYWQVPCEHWVLGLTLSIQGWSFGGSACLPAIDLTRHGRLHDPVGQSHDQSLRSRVRIPRRHRRLRSARRARSSSRPGPRRAARARRGQAAAGQPAARATRRLFGRTRHRRDRASRPRVPEPRRCRAAHRRRDGRAREPDRRRCARSRTTAGARKWSYCKSSCSAACTRRCAPTPLCSHPCSKTRSSPRSRGPCGGSAKARVGERSRRACSSGASHRDVAWPARCRPSATPRPVARLRIRRRSRQPDTRWHRRFGRTDAPTGLAIASTSHPNPGRGASLPVRCHGNVITADRPVLRLLRGARG